MLSWLSRTKFSSRGGVPSLMDIDQKAKQLLLDRTKCVNEVLRCAEFSLLSGDHILHLSWVIMQTFSKQTSCFVYGWAIQPCAELTRLWSTGLKVLLALNKWSRRDFVRVALLTDHTGTRCNVVLSSGNRVKSLYSCFCTLCCSSMHFFLHRSYGRLWGSSSTELPSGPSPLMQRQLRDMPYCSTLSFAFREIERNYIVLHM